MMAFLIVSVALTLAVVLRLLWPLWRGGQGGTLSLTEVNSTVYRDQLHELERDLARGQLAETNYQEARDELQRRLLQDLGSAGSASADSARPTGAKRVRWTALALALLVPMGAAGLYKVVGNVAAIDVLAASNDTPPRNADATAERLAQALQKSPDNPNGWVLLARAYRSAGRYTDAVKAFERATPLVDTSAELLIEHAEALFASSGNRLEGRPMELVRKALLRDPRHPMGLMLTGTSAYHRADYAGAIAEWEKLLAVLPAGSDEARDVQYNIEQARGLGGTARTSQTAADTPDSATRARSISGELVIAPALAAQVSPDDIVFIVARPDDGSRMPLAVLRRKVSDLPLKFTLDDSLAMMPDRKLSGARTVTVVARISRSGQAVPQPGDLTSEAVAAAPGARGLRLVIDRRL